MKVYAKNLLVKASEIVEHGVTFKVEPLGTKFGGDLYVVIHFDDKLENVVTKITSMPQIQIVTERIEGPEIGQLCVDMETKDFKPTSPSSFPISFDISKNGQNVNIKPIGIPPDLIDKTYIYIFLRAKIY